MNYLFDRKSVFERVDISFKYGSCCIMSMNNYCAYGRYHV
ncbi:homing endonuclease [Klebsiella phage vB_KpnM-VAC66]|nr:homing endonuclease [Klebsiella phage vB_KpnM-VAC66]